MNNIGRWKVKRQAELILPIAALYEQGDRHFGKPELDIATGMHTLYGTDSTYIRGEIKGERIRVLEMECEGEESGATYHETLLPALKRSTGIYEVVCVWEGGDSITRLTVHDGVVTEEKIEL
jgi:hypothetical protein